MYTLHIYIVRSRSLYSDAASRTACEVSSDSEVSSDPGSSESGSRSSDIMGPLESEENATFAGGDPLQPGLHRSYGVFLGLIAANALAVALAVWWYRWKKRTWVPAPEEIQESTDEFQVDYSILKRRLELVAEELSGPSDTTAEPLSYEDFKVGFDAGVLYSRAQGVWSWVDSRSQGSVGTTEITSLYRGLGDSNEFDGWKCPERSTVEELMGLGRGHECRVDEDQYFTRLQSDPQLLREVQKWFAVLNQRLGLLPTKVSDERELKLLRILSGTRQAQPDGEIGELSVASSSIDRLRDGFRQGMAWYDIYADWGLDSTRSQLVSYWHETPSEQAWSKYHCMSLYVSEYSDTQDPAMIQLWENMCAASNLDGTAGVATSHRSERSEYYSGDAPSSTELWRVRRSALKASTTQHTSSESLSQLDSLLKRRNLHRAASWVKDLIQEASHVSIQDSLNALEDVNMVGKLAWLSSAVATDGESTTHRASGQQMEAATLRLVLHKTARNKCQANWTQTRGATISPSGSARSTGEQLTSAELHSAAIQAVDVVAAHHELCREGSRFGMSCLRSICAGSTLPRPNDQFVMTWRIRLNICDVDLSTVGGLELIDMLKEIHVNCTRATSTARIARCQTACWRNGSLPPVIIEKLRLKRMSASTIARYAPTIFSEFLRIEHVDLHGCEISRHLEILVAALPDSGIRTLDLSYCNITQKFVKTLIEQLCPAQTDSSVEFERSCCSICRMSDVSGLGAIKPLVGVDAVEWQGQRVGRETLFEKLRGETAVDLRWIDSEGRPLSSTFQNKRELGMRWPDPKRLQACRRCGLPASLHVTSGSRRATRWKLDKRVHSLTSLNVVGNPLALSSQDMIHILEDNPQLHTLCGLTPGQTSVDWSPSERDPRKKTLIDCLLLAADLRVARASAHVRTVDIGGNPLFPQLTHYLRTKGSGAKEHPSDMHVDVELCRWISVCRAIRERFDLSTLNEFCINDTGLQQVDTAFCVLTAHGLPTVRSAERWSMLERVSCDGWRVIGIDLEETLIQSRDGFSSWLREAILHASMSHELLPSRSWADNTLRRLDLGETCLQAKDIVVLAESIAGDSLIALESLVVGEESTPEHPNPHPRYELDSQWSHIDFTAQRYCSSLWPADLMLLGKWICKPNVMKNLRRLSLRSTGMERLRSAIDDPCVGGNACTGADSLSLSLSRSLSLSLSLSLFLSLSLSLSFFFLCVTIS